MVYLVVTGANDTEACSDWILDKFLEYLDPDVPLHINRYFPANRWREQPTDLKLLLGLRDKALREGLNYVYVGNVWSPELESTYCPRCEKLLIYRHFRTIRFDLTREGGFWACPRCGQRVPMRGEIAIDAGDRAGAG